MTEPQALPFGQSTRGVLLIQGVLGPSVGAVFGAGFGFYLSWQADQSIESTLLVAIALWALAAGGLVFVILSLVLRRLRAVIWGWLPRSLRALRSAAPRITISTAKQRAEADFEDKKLRQQIAKLNERVKTEMAHTWSAQHLPQALQDQVSELEAQVATERALAKKSFERGLSEGRAEFSPASARPILPLPRPRWAIYGQGAEQEEFVVRNYVPRSVAREVRIESDADFRIFGAGHWEDLSGESSGTFTGSLRASGFASGVRFTIKWFDENGEMASEHYFASGDELSPGF